MPRSTARRRYLPYPLADRRGAENPCDVNTFNNDMQSKRVTVIISRFIPLSKAHNNRLEWVQKKPPYNVTCDWQGVPVKPYKGHVVSRNAFCAIWECLLRGKRGSFMRGSNPLHSLSVLVHSDEGSTAGCRKGQVPGQHLPDKHHSR